MTANSTPERVRIYTRTDCHLCDVAKAEVDRICTDLGIGFTVVDVDSVPELRAEYGDRVPVILVDGCEHAQYRVDEQRLRAALG